MARILKKPEDTSAPSVSALVLKSKTRRCSLEREVIDGGQRVLKLSTYRLIGKGVALESEDHRDLPIDSTQDVLDSIEILKEMTHWNTDFCRKAIQIVMLGW